MGIHLPLANVLTMLEAVERLRIGKCPSTILLFYTLIKQQNLHTLFITKRGSIPGQD